MNCWRGWAVHVRAALAAFRGRSALELVVGAQGMLEALLRSDFPFSALVSVCDQSRIDSDDPREHSRALLLAAQAAARPGFADVCCLEE